MASAVQNTDHSKTETLPPGQLTTLKRAEQKAIRSFKLWMIGSDTIGTLLDNGWSLGICCRHCERTIEMKLEAIEDRFGPYRAMPLANLLPKMVCGEPQGCGSTDMVLFPWKVKPPKVKVGKPTAGELQF